MRSARQKVPSAVRFTNKNGGDTMISAKEAIKKLEEGNKKYLTENTGSGDISPAARLRTCANGQQPYAIVIACSDSRVIPESIFSAEIGAIYHIDDGHVEFLHE